MLCGLQSPLYVGIWAYQVAWLNLSAQNAPPERFLCSHHNASTNLLSYSGRSLLLNSSKFNYITTTGYRLKRAQESPLWVSGGNKYPLPFVGQSQRRHQNCHRYPRHLALISKTEAMIGTAEWLSCSLWWHIRSFFGYMLMLLCICRTRAATRSSSSIESGITAIKPGT